MRIGEVAEQVGVNPKTIRYYESIGLLPEPSRTAAGYRDYSPEDIDRLTFARRATQLNLQLDEIAEILALRDSGQRPCNYVLDVAHTRIRELGERIADMQRARDELTSLLQHAPTPPTADNGCYCELIEHRTSNPS